MIVAIDGPAGSGKSTVAKAVASRLSMRYLDTGAMYRSVAWKALREGIDLDDTDSLADTARSIEIEFVHEARSPLPTAVLVDKIDVTTAIRTPELDAAVSAVARVPEVREAMVGTQRSIGATGDLVAEGRDIGTVVFPDAQVKIFLTASVEERARRRHLELAERGEQITQDSVRDALTTRDDADSAREASPLTQAQDAHPVDTTGLTIEQVVDKIVALVRDSM